MPPWKVPVWLASPGTAELRATVPLRASTIEPTGTEAASVMATGARRARDADENAPGLLVDADALAELGRRGGRERGRRGRRPAPGARGRAAACGRRRRQRRRQAAGATGAAA